jgi:hypothetical protein
MTQEQQDEQQYFDNWIGSLEDGKCEGRTTPDTEEYNSGKESLQQIW